MLCILMTKVSFVDIHLYGIQSSNTFKFWDKS